LLRNDNFGIYKRSLSHVAVKRFLAKLGILGGMLLGLPFMGVLLAGFPVDRYLEFPPETEYVTHTSFSWVVFVICGLFIFATIFPLLLKGIQAVRRAETKSSILSPFPWWGGLGILTGLISWVLAWTRFPWFEIFQPYTFTPLWLSFILVINALTHRRKGRCMMLDRPAFFLLLFPTSAAFWWFFEYLNRFVQDWHYVGVRFDAWEYFWYATLPFSTVLPAVLGAREWILTFSWVEKGFARFFPISVSKPNILAWALLVVSGAGLAGIGVWPDYLFPLLWVSPLLIIVSLQVIMGESHILSAINEGDWRLVVCSALAALFCGFFWEMWNFFSLAKWEYSIPFVHRYQIFEMPVLGYAGYLPFGLEIAAIEKMMKKNSNK